MLMGISVDVYCYLCFGVLVHWCTLLCFGVRCCVLIDVYGYYCVLFGVDIDVNQISTLQYKLLNK